MISIKIKRITFQAAKRAVLNSLLNSEINNTKTYLESHLKTGRLIVSFSNKSLHFGPDGEKVATKQLLNPKAIKANGIIVKNFLRGYVEKLNEEDLLQIESLQTKYKMQSTLKEWVLTNYLDLRKKYSNYDLTDLGLTNNEVAKYLLAENGEDDNFLLDPEECSLVISGYTEKRPNGSIEEVTLLNKVAQSFFNRDKESNVALLELLIHAISSNRKALSKAQINLPMNLLLNVIDIYDGTTGDKITARRPLKITLLADSPKVVNDTVNAVLAQNDTFNYLSDELEKLEKLGVSFDTAGVNTNVTEWLNLFKSNPLNELPVINNTSNILAKLFNY